MIMQQRVEGWVCEADLSVMNLMALREAYGIVSVSETKKQKQFL